MSSPLIQGRKTRSIERWFLRRVHRYGQAHELLLTFGLSFIIDETIKLFFGNYPVDYRIPPALDFAAFSVGSQQYPMFLSRRGE